MKYYQKCVNFACNYFKNSSVFGDFITETPPGFPPLDPVGDFRPQTSCSFAPAPSHTSIFRRLWHLCIKYCDKCYSWMFHPNLKPIKPEQSQVLDILWQWALGPPPPPKCAMDRRYVSLLQITRRHRRFNQSTSYVSQVRSNDQEVLTF